MLEDGRYDAFVVDVEVVGPGDTVRLDVTILAGPHKGEVLSVQATGLGVDEVGAIGMPATLTVRDGEPALELEG